MGMAGSSKVGRLIQVLFDEGTVASLDDAELLNRFRGRGRHAEAAFAALVERHAPMVHRICRDVTGDIHDAQDAAQVTFLILAQKAGSIRGEDLLASWLFGTARRVAARALRDAVRRRRREAKYALATQHLRESVVRADACEWDWDRLYAELDRLPDRYRDPILLCDLKGLTHDQAAHALKCPPRTLETRLHRGRQRLRQRLTRHGLTPAGAVTTSAITIAGPPITIPMDWARSTTLAAMHLATRGAAATTVSPTVTSLARGVNRTMLVTRVKWAAALVVFLGVSVGLTLAVARMTPGAGIQQAANRADAPSTKSSTAKPAEPPQPAQITTPINVRGRATDLAGKPLVGASIYLVSTNGLDARLGETTTDHDGSYVFRQVRLPVRRPDEDDSLQGTFQVYGTAPGHGFAWHGMRWYQPRRRPADWNPSGEDYSIFGGEPMVMDLRFPPEATLAGRVVDESGRPVAGAKIRIANCDYLDAAGKETHHNFREFWAIGDAPASLTRSMTGPDGRFRMDGLPKEAGFLIDMEHPDFAGVVLYAATTARPTSAFDYPGQMIGPGQERPPVASGQINVTLRSTRRIAVRTVFADSGKPAKAVRVSAFRGAAGSGANGVTDESGRLNLRLPPGDYDVMADPTEGGAEMVRTRSTLKVTDQPAEQSLELPVKPGCVLILEAVDAETGDGIPAVEFMYEVDGGQGSRAQLQSRSGYIDNPRTDANGRLRAVVEPGERMYAVGRIAESSGYPLQDRQERVVLPAGQTVTVRFKLQRPPPFPRGRAPMPIARLKYDGDWNADPGALNSLMDALRKPPYRRDVAAKPKDLFARDPSLIYCPLIYLHGRGPLPLSKQDLDVLRRYLDPGEGTLFADAACGSPPFDAAFRRLAAQLLPNNPLVPIPSDDPIFAQKTYFDLSRCRYTKAAGGRQGFPQLEGVKIKDHWGIIYSKLGIGCALDREHDDGCKGYIPGDAFKIGANIVIYSTLP
jgi:RNA polymerase sigma factor (sigma-70 family)